MASSLRWWGICGCVLTFVGGGLLALDALMRMRDLRRKRTDTEFRREFPQLNLTDEELKAARTRVGWAIAGFVLLTLGFLCELVDRCVASH